MDSECGHFSTADVSAAATESVRRLLAAFQQLEFSQTPLLAESAGADNDVWARIELRPPLLHRRAKTFLAELECTAQALDLPMASRKYRHSFTRNYRALMPADKRMYRVDVLEAGQEAHNVLWVNGTRYVLPDQVLLANCKFRSSWAVLLTEIQKLIADTLVCTTDPTVPNTGHPDRLGASDRTKPDWLARLGLPLIRFDMCWTEFERHYIEALMAIEQEARFALMDCLYTDEELSLYEALYRRIARPSSGGVNVEPEVAEASLESLSRKIRERYAHLVTQVGQLNTCANVRRKGRADFCFTTLETATRVLCAAESHKVQQCTKIAAQVGNDVPTPVTEKYPWVAASLSTGRSVKNGPDSAVDCWMDTATLQELETLRPLAEPLLHDMESLRQVFSTLALSPERIDPHLAQNVSLAEALAQFEARWDDARAYLESQPTLQSLTAFLAFLNHVLELDLRVFSGQAEEEPASTVSALLPFLLPGIGSLPLTVDLNGSREAGRRLPMCDTLQERIASLDVSAFLAVSRVAVLFCVSSTPAAPAAFTKRRTTVSRSNAALLKQLLPDTFLTLKTEPKGSSSLCDDDTFVFPTSACSDAVSLPTLPGSIYTSLLDYDATTKNSFGGAPSFFGQRDTAVSLRSATCDIPPALHRVVRSGLAIASICSRSGTSSAEVANLENHVLLYVLERCVKNGGAHDNESDQYTRNLPRIEGLAEAVRRFINALEEASIVLQRTNPKEWNAFLHTSLKCLQSFRSVVASAPCGHEVCCCTVSTSSSSPRLNPEEDDDVSSSSLPLRAEPSSPAQPHTSTPCSGRSRSKMLHWWLLEGSPAPPSPQTPERQVMSRFVTSTTDAVRRTPL